MSPQAAVCVSTSDLRVGSTIRHPLHDSGATLLLAAGSVITDRIKRQLSKRHIDKVYLHSEDAAAAAACPASPTIVTRQSLAKRLSRSLSDRASVGSKVEALVSTISFVVENTGPPIRQAITPHSRTAYDHRQRDRLIARFGAAASLVDKMVHNVLRGAQQNADQLATVAGDYITEMAEDTDQVVASTSLSSDGQKVNERSVRLAILGMAVAIEMGFDAKNVRQVGLCGLVHDWGIFRLPDRLGKPQEPFSSNDWLVYRTHPLQTFELLQRVNGIPDAVRVAAFHVHEQANGTGFPKGLRKERIHPYARILNVVDAYLSLTSQIHGRPAFIPYDAMVYLLHHTRTGEFDSEVVSAFLQVFSLFPIGSHVRLSDGTQAKVLRRNGLAYTQPLVQRLPQGNGSYQASSDSPADLVDLAFGDLQVETALPTPHRREMRLDPDLIAEIHWDGPDC